MASTISTSITGPVTLGTADNPLTITNTGMVTSTGSGVDGIDGPAPTFWTIGNNGAVTASGRYGVRLDGGIVTNGRSISGGNDGVLISGAIGTVANDGSITGANFEGVYLGSGGSVTNAASASISGGANGVLVLGGGTVTDDGTISGAYAVQFGNSATNRLIVDPAAVFIGAVGGGATSASNALELAGGSGTIGGLSAGSGTATENAHSWSFTNFHTIDFDAGADWTFTGADTIASGDTLTNDGTLALAAGATLDIAGALTASGTFDLGDGTQALILGASASGGQGGSFAPAITDFGIGDKIEVGGFTPPANPVVVFNSVANTLTIESGGSVVYTFDDVVPAAGVTSFVAGTDSSTGDLFVEAACFLAGTRLATAAGEIAVEDLCAGDRVITASGGSAPVVWIGQRLVACRRHPRPWLVQPVRIRAGAFADGLPRRDLLLSPDHAVFAEDVLIPVKYLVNGLDIVQETAESVHYFHVELERHNILLAEGLPAESYLDTGNRAQFANGAAHVTLHPDFSPLSWADACAPLCLAGPVLAAVRRRLRERAEALGYLEVLADGHPVRAAAMRGRMHRFLLPRGTREIRVGSRMGLSLESVFVNGRAIPVPPGGPAQTRLRLPLAPFRGGPMLLEVLLGEAAPKRQRAEKLSA